MPAHLLGREVASAYRCRAVSVPMVEVGLSPHLRAEEWRQ